MIGNGTNTNLRAGLPLTEVSLDRELSGPGGLRATLKPEMLDLRAADGGPLFVPWSTAIFAEKDGKLRGGGILANAPERHPELSIDCIGFAGYPSRQPYTGNYSAIDVDPLDVFRMVWQQLQDSPHGNLGMQVDDTKSPVRIGKHLPPERSPGGNEGPYILAYHNTPDLGVALDDLAERTPFDYTTEYFWEGEEVRARLRLGYPRIGARRTDLRFVVGENIFTPPEVDPGGEDYASHVMVLGAGDGEKMIRGHFTDPDPGRLRRAVVVENKALTDQAAAERQAAAEVRWRAGTPDFDKLTVHDTEQAPIGSYDVGDEIQVRTRGGWYDGLDLWVRILGISTNPELNTEELTVIRAEKV